MTMTNAKFNRQKIAYAKKLLKKAQLLSFQPSYTGYVSQGLEYRKAQDYCEKWIRYIDDKKKRNTLEVLCRRADWMRKGAYRMADFLANDAQANLERREYAARLYRQMNA